MIRDVEIPFALQMVGHREIPIPNELIREAIEFFAGVRKRRGLLPREEES